MKVEVETGSVAPSSLKDQFSATVPVIYADQVMGLAFGPFVSRLTVGIEDAMNSKRVATATLVMPTNMLHVALNELSKQLSSEETRAQFEQQYKDYLEGSKGTK
jgi:hypothetical protein